MLRRQNESLWPSGFYGIHATTNDISTLRFWCRDFLAIFGLLKFSGSFLYWSYFHRFCWVPLYGIREYIGYSMASNDDEQPNVTTADQQLINKFARLHQNFAQIKVLKFIVNEKVVGNLFSRYR